MYPAAPTAARVFQIEGQKANPSNYLLMHAMGPNCCRYYTAVLQVLCLLCSPMAIRDKGAIDNETKKISCNCKRYRIFLGM